MRIRSAFVGVAAAAMVTSVACQQEPPPPPPEAPKPVAAKPAEPATPKTHPECVGPMTAGAPQALEFAGVKWEYTGAMLTQKEPAAAAQLVIGAITDIKEDTDENKANLKRFVDWFKQKKADVLVVAGDTGETQAQIESAIGVVAEAKLPVFVIIGNREGREPYKAALTALHAKYGNVFDLNAVRRIDTPAADIVSMPGYYNPAYIHAKDGCAYSAEDVVETGKIASAANSPVVLVSHGGPRMDGAEGVDRTTEGANVGDPELAKLLAGGKVPFGIFGNIHEAGGRATDAAGKTVLKAGEAHASLYLNPGPADAVRWVMNDGTSSVGMAALLTIKDGKGSYEIFRAPDPEAKVAAGKLKKAKK